MRFNIKILIYPPTNPVLSYIYIPAGIILALVLSYVIASASLLLPRKLAVLLLISAILISTTPLLSYFNIIIKEIILTEKPEIIYTYVTLYGIAIPVPLFLIKKRKLVIAINIGGAIIPLIISSIFLFISYKILGFYSFLVFVFSFIITSIVTYHSSRVVPGVGIVVPSLVPPLTASLVVLLLVGPGLPGALIAYASSVVGSLIGADVMRLMRSLRELQAGLASIGGVGVFDGIFLSGYLALILVL